MTSMSMNRTRESPFRESEWDRRLDDMLEDLGGGQGPAQALVARPGGGQVISGQHYSSTSMQQSYSYSSSSSSQQQNQVRMQTSSSAQQQSRVTNGGRTATNNYSMNKSASASSMKNNADDVLKDLETGLKKSTNYIEELQGRYQGPEGGQEWREVHRGGDPGAGDYSLEHEVQHMIGGMDSTESQQQQSAVQQQQQQQYGSVNQHNLTTYKVQSNQYGASGERLLSPNSGANGMFDEDADRPASRLKQNIDDLDTLLYDLNNARTLSPDPGPDYGNTGLGPGHQGLDSDDYDETGHVKRTVQAFNEFSTSSQVTELSGAEAVSSGKPPSPSPRRKTQPSPVTSRKTPTTPQQQQRPQQTSYSQQHQQSYNTSSYSSSSQMMSSEADNRQEFSPAMSQLAHDPEPPQQQQPSYYTKYSSAAPSSPLPTSVAFPNHQPRSGTPQSPPKRVEELMSEFQEFDTSHGSVSPTPAMFSRPRAEVSEQHDGPPRQIKLEPQPKLSPPPAPASVNQKGPEVYYPPGAEFTKSVQASHPVGDGGSMSLHEKGRGERRNRDRAHDRGAEGGDKQGAAVIPICLPLCCAAPCVIM